MGDASPYFEDVNEGDEAPVRSHIPAPAPTWCATPGASGDYNPMHHDEVKATAAGQPSVFGHGMFSMGFLGTAITDYVGVGGSPATGAVRPADVARRGAVAPGSW